MFKGTHARCDSLTGKVSRLSLAYMRMPIVICRMLDLQTARLLDSLAFESAGNSIAAKMAMMAMTTKSSIKVKAFRREKLKCFGFKDFIFIASNFKTA